MSASLGILMLLALATAEPNITLNQLQKNCEKLAADIQTRDCR